MLRIYSYGDKVVILTILSCNSVNNTARTNKSIQMIYCESFFTLQYA